MLGYICFAFAASIILLALGALFVGIGFGFTIPLLNHMMVEVSTSKTQGKNLGLYSMGVFAGQFISTFIEFVANDARIIFGTASVLSLLIAAVFFILFKKNKAYSINE